MADISELSELVRALELEEPLIAFDFPVPADGLKFERACGRERRLVVAVADPEQFEDVLGNSAIRPPQGVELLGAFGRVEALRFGEDGPRPESVELPVFGLVEDLCPVERAARVSPIQRRNQTLGPVEQFLPSDAGPQL